MDFQQFILTVWRLKKKFAVQDRRVSTENWAGRRSFIFEFFTSKIPYIEWQLTDIYVIWVDTMNSWGNGELSVSNLEK